MTPIRSSRPNPLYQQLRTSTPVTAARPLERSEPNPNLLTQRRRQHQPLPLTTEETLPITQDPREDLNTDTYQPTERDLERALADMSLEDWQGTPTPAAAPPDQNASRNHDTATTSVPAAADPPASVPCSTQEQRYDAVSSEVRQAYGPLAYSIYLDVQLDLITVTEAFTQLPQKVNRLRSTLYVYDRQCRPLNTDTPEVSLSWIDEIHELLGSGAWLLASRPHTGRSTGR